MSLDTERPEGARGVRGSLPYRPALDGVRGVAVTGVLLFHGGVLSGGFLGVDLFFVLSGYLITALLMIEAKNGRRIELGRFWARRARRLLPALAALLLAVALYCTAFAEPEALAGIRRDAWATLLYVPNWHAAFAEHDYWELFLTPSPLQHTWSLGIEEQFYLVWPLCIAAAWGTFGGRTPAVVGIGSLILAGASALAMWTLYEPDAVARVYFGTDTRAASILLGAACAAAHVRLGPARTRCVRGVTECAAAVGWIVLAMTWWQWDGQAPALYRGGFALCGLAGVAVISAAAQPRPGPLTRVLSWTPLRLLGVISYGVYLWHWPLYLVLDETRTGLAGAPLLALRIAATLLVSAASYRLLERPIRRGALRARHWLWVAPGVAATVVLSIALATGGARPPRDARATAKPAPAAAASRPDDERIRVLVLGDSTGVSIYEGLGRIADDYRLAPTLGVQFGCEANVAAAGCPPPWAEQVATLRPDVVLLIETGFWNLVPLRVGSRVHAIGSPGWDDAWLAERQEGLDALLAAGAERVVITTQPCFETSWWRRQPRLSPRNTAHANAGLSMLAGRNAERVTLVDLGGQICPEGQGPAASARVDGIHYTPETADRIARWLAPQLVASAPADPLR